MDPTLPTENARLFSNFLPSSDIRSLNERKQASHQPAIENQQSNVSATRPQSKWSLGGSFLNIFFSSSTEANQKRTDQNAQKQKIQNQKPFIQFSWIFSLPSRLTSCITNLSLWKNIKFSFGTSSPTQEKGNNESPSLSQENINHLFEKSPSDPQAISDDNDNRDTFSGIEPRLTNHSVFNPNTNHSPPSKKSNFVDENKIKEFYYSVLD